MKSITFVTGGCRSGKSDFALKEAEKVSGERVFIATCVPQDDEMKSRVTRHQRERDATWKTVEEPIRLPEALINAAQVADVVLIDCLTLWVSNLILISQDQEKFLKNLDELSKALDEASCQVFIVSNEVGMGIVPENRLARIFRDFTGWANQRVADCSDRVFLTVSGIPLRISPAP